MMLNPTPRFGTSRFVLIAISCLILLPGLGSARLWDRDEPRNSGCSAEMLARGDWIVPTFNNQLRDHKPVLLYWCQMLSYQAFGRSEWSARFPSAALALATILATAYLASRLSRDKPASAKLGFWVGASLATCLLFVMAGRAATPDSCLVAFSTLGIVCLSIGSAAGSNQTRPLQGNELTEAKLGRVAWHWASLGYASLGMAMLAKGPVGLVLPMAVLMLWRMLNAPRNSSTNWFIDVLQNAWRVITELRAIPGCVLAMLVAAPWYIAVGVATDGEFLRGFFLNHNLGRAVSSMEGHHGSIFFYPLAILVGIFPWSLWLIPIALWAKQTIARQRWMITLAVAWLTVYVGAFSFASTKLPSYITPCYPGVALLIGGFLTDFASGRNLPGPNWRWAGSILGICVATGSAITIILLASIESMPMVAWAAIGAVTMAVCCAIGWFCDSQHRTGTMPVAWCAGAVAFCVGLFGIGTSQASRYRQDIDALTKIQSQHPSGPWLTAGVLEPSWVYYLRQPLLELQTPNSEESRAKFENVLNQQLATHQQLKIILPTGSADYLENYQQEPSQPQKRFYQAAQLTRFLRSEKLAVYICETTTPRSVLIADPGRVLLPH